MRRQLGRRYASQSGYGGRRADGQAVFFNSGHLCNGITQRVPLQTPAAPAEALDGGWRRYASATVGGQHTVAGCADGHLHLLDNQGRLQWEHHKRQQHQRR